MTVLRGRWGYQTGLFQRSMPAFWLYLGLLLLCGLLIGIVQVFYAASTPVPWLLSWGLLVLYIIPVVLIVRWLDLYEREPKSLVIAAFLWGATVAVTFSSFANVSWGLALAKLAGAEFASEWSAALTAPFIEEIYKALGVVVLYLIARAEFDDEMDGFVFGAMVGLGFTVIEDIDYFINVFGGTIAGVLEGFWVRVIASGLYGHVLYTGLTGIGVAYFVTRRGEASLRRRLGVAFGMLALAIGAHFFWNSPLIWEELPLFAATAVKGMPFLIVLGLALRLARRRQRRWLAAALETEVGRAGLLAEEMEMLRDPGRAKAARRAVREVAGRGGLGLLKELQRRQVDLSMVATRVDRSDHPDLVRARNRVRSLREPLWSMPGVVGALGIPESTVEAVRAMPAEIPWEPDVMTHAPLDWWTEPDGTRPPAGQVAPGTSLMVVTRNGAWAGVLAGNGWSGWVDGRYLAPIRRNYWQ